MVLPLSSQAIIDAIPGTDQWDNLCELLDQLAGWEEKPEFLAAMAYQWSLAICECIRKVDQIPVDPMVHRLSHRLHWLVECERDGISRRKLAFESHVLLLAKSLEIGFHRDLDSKSGEIQESIKLLVNEEHHPHDRKGGGLAVLIPQLREETLYLRQFPIVFAHGPFAVKLRVSHVPTHTAARVPSRALASDVLLASKTSYNYVPRFDCIDHLLIYLFIRSTLPVRLYTGNTLTSCLMVLSGVCLNSLLTMS